MTTTALQLYEKIQNPIVDATNERMVKAVATFTRCTPDQAPAVMLTCLSEGISLREYGRTYHTMMGQSVMKSQAMLANFRAKYGGNHEIVERSSERAAIVLTAKDGVTFPHEFTAIEAMHSRWPWKDWQKAHVQLAELEAKGKVGSELFAAMQPHMKDNWGTPTDWRAMLWWRCVAEAIDTFCPEVDSGACSLDEALDVSLGPVFESPRLSAAEAIAKASTNGAAAQEVVTDIPAGERVLEGELVDAIGEGDPASEATAEDSAPLGEGFATRAQIDRLRELYDECSIPYAKQQEALAKRKCNSLRNLTTAQIQEMIDKLVAFSQRNPHPAPHDLGN